jgi:hypothetical protein
MYRVIEAIPFDAQVIRSLPDCTLGPGLMVTLDVRANSPEESLVFESKSYRVHRPDGTFLDCEATAVGWTKGSTEENVSLFFPKLSSHDIPRSSRIQLMPAVLTDPTPE